MSYAELNAEIYGYVCNNLTTHAPGGFPYQFPFVIRS